MKAALLWNQVQILANHFIAKLLPRCFVRPTEIATSFGGVPDQCVHFGGTEVPSIDLNVDSPCVLANSFFVNSAACPMQLYANISKRPFDEIAHSGRLARC